MSYMLIIWTLHMVSYEQLYSDLNAFQDSCHYLISWPTVIGNSLFTPILCRAYNVQFQFHLHWQKDRKGIAASQYNRRYTTTFKYNLLFVAVSFVIYNLPALIASFVVPLRTDPQSVTECLDYFIYVMLGQACIPTPIFNYVVKKFWRLQDPYNIKTEFLYFMIVAYSCAFGWYIIQVTDTVYNSTLFPSTFQPMFIFDLLPLCVLGCCVWYPIYLVIKEKRKDLGISPEFADGRPHINVTLPIILNNENYFREFKAVTIQYWCVESLLFVVDVNKYEALQTDAERESLAKIIVTNYLDPESPLNLNLPAVVSNEIKDNISKKQFTSSLFHPAYNDVAAQLEGILIRWKTTPEFQSLADQRRNSSDSRSRSSIIMEMKDA